MLPNERFPPFLQIANKTIFDANVITKIAALSSFDRIVLYCVHENGINNNQYGVVVVPENFVPNPSASMSQTL